MRKAAEGWTLAAVEWVREVEDRDAILPPLAAGFATEEAPYGLRVSETRTELEENPLETTVLLLILEKIVQEKRLNEIATELNRSGYTTRRGSRWNSASVFDLLPRLIEAGPALLKSDGWRRRREELPPSPQQNPIQ